MHLQDFFNEPYAVIVERALQKLAFLTVLKHLTPPTKFTK